MPHLRRAIEFDRHFRSLEVEREIAFDALDHVSAGLVLIDRQGKIIACNRVADEIVALNDGLCIDGEGLAAAVSSETRKLRILIYQAARGKGRRGGSLSLTRPSGKPDFDALVTCFCGASLEGVEERHIAAVLINDPGRAGASPS
jgi:PAS domain-containing protein